MALCKSLETIVKPVLKYTEVPNKEKPEISMGTYYLPIICFIINR